MLLAVVLVEIGWRLPLVTFSWSGPLPPSPVVTAVLATLSHVFPPPVLMPWAAGVLAIVTAQVLSYLIVTLLCVAIIRYRTGYVPPMGRAGAEALAWIVGTIIAIYVIRVAVRIPDYLQGSIAIWDFLLSACSSIVVRPDQTTSLPLFLFSLSLTVVFSPICEEVLYRGLLVDGLLPAIGLVPTAIVTSLLFSLNHFMQSPDLPMSTDLFLSGLILFAARMRFGGIGVPIALHLVMNAVIIFEALLKCT